jgi:hypothetical protein
MDENEDEPHKNENAKASLHRTRFHFDRCISLGVAGSAMRCPHRDHPSS